MMGSLVAESSLSSASSFLHHQQEQPPSNHHQRRRLDDGSTTLHLAHTLGSHMVLQQAPRSSCLWGRAMPKANLTLSIDDDAVDVIITTADEEGKWMACLAPHEAGGPHQVRFVCLSLASHSFKYDMPSSSSYLPTYPPNPFPPIHRSKSMIMLEEKRSF